MPKYKVGFTRGGVLCYTYTLAYAEHKLNRSLNDHPGRFYGSPYIEEL